ncbi:HpcH/HpaI aldolase [Candidatus Sulfotelmatomonas gaucii]|uniref:HpcH/HpaI aldolase n=1 Tax=Candidatus Sulfuritelmatomonas gaucii TaxID=2043161 RepID=A0A2N9L839_9BACT|nr:HpcH/HpaI aldolase [Candidatus Sulfotelmatomonas gaucii]
MNRLQQAVHANDGKALLGAAAYFYDPVFLEICAHLGYQAIWIEMEHGHITFAEAADLCRMAAGTGMLTMIRIPDVRRENVLKGAECGPDILDVPMIESAAQMHDLREYARFAPQGSRGMFSVSRAINYGIPGDVVAKQQKLNTGLCLMAQIETSTAVDRVEELAAVPDVDLFIGPADLAASFGVPGQTSHSSVQQAASKIVKAARIHDKCVATACAPEEFGFWLGLGIDLLFCANDISCLKQAASDMLGNARKALLHISKNSARDLKETRV